MWSDRDGRRGRLGVGRARHAQARLLWLPLRASEKELTLKKVKGAINEADSDEGKTLREHLGASAMKKP